jgi:hypothetical protein
MGCRRHPFDARRGGGCQTLSRLRVRGSTTALLRRPPHTDALAPTLPTSCRASQNSWAGSGVAGESAGKPDSMPRRRERMVAGGVWRGPKPSVTRPVIGLTCLSEVWPPNSPRVATAVFEWSVCSARRAVARAGHSGPQRPQGRKRWRIGDDLRKVVCVAVAAAGQVGRGRRARVVTSLRSARPGVRGM